VFHEPYHLFEDMARGLGVNGDDRNPDGCPLPQVLVVNFRNRDIEMGPYSVLETPDHLTFVFERAAVANQAPDTYTGDYHRSPRSPCDGLQGTGLFDYGVRFYDVAHFDVVEVLNRDTAFVP